MSVEEHRKLLSEINVDVDRHAKMMNMGLESYKTQFMSQKNRPEGMKYFDWFMSEIQGQRIAEINELRKQKKPAVGAFCIFVPEEIIVGAGGACFGLCGGSPATIADAETELPRNICPLIKSAHGFKLQRTCAYTQSSDFIYGETTCEAKKKTWEILNKHHPVHVMNIPHMKRDKDLKMWKEEIVEFKEHIEEVEEYGGMSKAIEAGIPKMRIEEAAARRQAKIDSGTDVIVGVNRYETDSKEEIELLEVDNESVRKSQIERLQKLRAERNDLEVQTALNNLAQVAAGGEGNLLAAAIDCARKRASLGEISDAMEKSFGRYKAVIKSISGVYSSEVMEDKNFIEARRLSDEFSELDGRRPRIMVAKMGQDGHDRGAKVIATSFADIGFDVDIGPLFQTPKEAAKQAIENDVHILGVSSLAAGHKTLVPKVIEALKEFGREDILVIAGGVIPPNDYDFLFESGVAGVYGPGTKIPKAAQEILNILIEAYK